MAVSILKCPYCSDSIRKSGAYIVGIAGSANGGDGGDVSHPIFLLFNFRLMGIARLHGKN